MCNCSNCNERHLDRDCPNRPPPEPLCAPATAAGAGTADPPQAARIATGRCRPAGDSPQATCHRDAAAATRPGTGEQKSRPGANHSALRSRMHSRASALRSPLWHRTHRDRLDVATRGGQHRAPMLPMASGPQGQATTGPHCPRDGHPANSPAQLTPCSLRGTSPNARTIHRPLPAFSPTRSAALWRPSPCVFSACSCPPPPPSHLSGARTHPRPTT